MIGNPLMKDDTINGTINRGFLARPHSEYETLGSELNKLRVPHLKVV